MRHFIIFLFGIACLTPQINGQEDAGRTLRLKIVNQKSKPLKKTDLIYQIGNLPTLSKTDRYGMLLINGVTDTDTIFVLVSGYNPAMFPAAGLDSVKLVLMRTQVGETSGDVNIGYQTISSNNSTLPGAQLKPDRQMGAYSDLASYLQGRSGLQVRRGATGMEVIIRGGNNSLYQSSAALIVVDGVTFRNFDAVNNLIHPNDVKSIDILKDGSIYGSQGANGVVIITTKRGGD